MQLKYYTGSDFVTIPEEDGKVKYYTGSEWVNAKWVRYFTGQQWLTAWEVVVEPPPDEPDPGEYILPPTSLYIGDHTGYAEFQTDYYQGHISEVKAQVTWRDAGGYTTGFDIAGRPSGNNYRYIENNAGEWDGRVISHGISSFDPAALTEFNSGAATGYSLDGGTFVLNRMISYVRLILIV